MSSGHREVAGAEALVGGLITAGFASVATGMRREAHVDAANQDCVDYLRRVDANARAIVRSNAAAKMSGTGALLDAYNRRVRATSRA